MPAGQPPTALWLVVSGLVKLTRSTDGGAELVVAFRTPGWLVGAGSAILSRRLVTSAETVGDCELCELRLADFHRARQDPAVGDWLLQLQARELRDFVTLVGQFGALDLPDRLEALLARLARGASTADRDGSVRLPPLTHEELASAVGASRARVTQDSGASRRPA